MNLKTGIIDYGMGNLHSVKNAFDFIGADSFISSDMQELEKADSLILPGVGAFPDAMDALDGSGLSDFIRRYSEKKPLLGICLGMQLLFEKSFEIRERQGLALVRGEIVAVAKSPDFRLKVPHMGWNRLSVEKASKLMRQSDGESVYFVHSFKAVPKDREDILAVCDYGGEICAAVEKNMIFGTQFHPEKSHNAGLEMLKNFIEITKETLC